ncbi:TPA: DUF2776 domain-containing protein [Escherichia coli]|nr:DUF2776 domain-containing protein [Escherichia coli]
MNIYIGWLFKLIPLLMGIICIALGEFVLTGSGQSEYFVAGHVLISLSAICLALFTTAFIIISQLTHGMNKFYNKLFPVIGYAGSATTMIWGWSLLASNNVMADEFVAGHVIFGVGMIAACVSTVAASSGHFLLIPKNASGSKSDGTPLQAYSSTIGNCLIAGHVLMGLTAICACLIGLVATIVHQTRNTFSVKEHWLWCYWVILLGSLTIIFGIYVLISSDASARLAPGIILICLGMICYSIFSKVWLLALVWRRTCSLANRIPMIPVFTCLFCLFLAAFLAEIAQTDMAYFIPSRVLVGLGAVCFTLFSIVSILEAGSAKK